MATLRTRTVKSAGGDYSSLSAWEAGEQTNIVTADEIREAECYSMQDTNAVTIEGWTTDATRFIRVRVATGERHDGKWNTSKYRLEVTTAGRSLDIQEDYVVIDGVQINQTATSGNPIITRAIGVGITQYENCIIKGTFSGTATFAVALRADTLGNTVKCKNTIIYDISGTGGTGFLCNNGTLITHNCTVHNCVGTAYERSAGTFIAKNCIAQDCGDGFAGTFDAASTNNCSDIASDAPGSNARTGEVTFVDEANDDFHLASGDTVAKDAGVDLSADANYPFSDDIDGATRTGTWDIGADEYVAVGGGSSAWNPRLASGFFMP